MKQQHILPFLLLAVIAGLCGCSQNELTDIESSDATIGTLTVTVTDGGYASDASSSGPLTRTLENGYTTTFTAGDAIGVFAKKDDVVLNEVNNLRFTAKDNGSGGLVWTDDDGNALPKIPGATYLAYYPYREGITSDNLYGTWEVATDQGSHSKYTSQDLMSMAYSSPSGNTLSFTMYHQLALVVLDLPRTKYTFNNTSPEIADYYMDAPDTKFNGFTPCRMSDGTYRYLVKPEAGTTLSGSYTNASGAMVEWEFTPDVYNGGYKIYQVDGGSATIVTEKSHTLAVGDYYLKDGSLVGKDETLTDQRKADCIGLVFYVGQHESDGYDYSTTGIGQAKCHGYVLALTNVNAGSSDRLRWEYRASDGAYKQRVGTSTSRDDWNGYSNTKVIETYVANSGGSWAMTDFPAANGCLLYGTENSLNDWQKGYTAPKNSSGWFLPSAGQLKYLSANSSDLSAKIRGLGSSLSDSYIKWFNTNLCYWSSSEYSEGSNGVNSMDFQDNSVGWNTGNNQYDVRAVCAF